jgi:hypothetical protein
LKDAAIYRRVQEMIDGIVKHFAIVCKNADRHNGMNDCTIPVSRWQQDNSNASMGNKRSSAY